MKRITDEFHYETAWGHKVTTHLRPVLGESYKSYCARSKDDGMEPVSESTYKNIQWYAEITIIDSDILAAIQEKYGK